MISGPATNQDMVAESMRCSKAAHLTAVRKQRQSERKRLGVNYSLLGHTPSDYFLQLPPLHGLLKFPASFNIPLSYEFIGGFIPHDCIISQRSPPLNIAALETKLLIHELLGGTFQMQTITLSLPPLPKTKLSLLDGTGKIHTWGNANPQLFSVRELCELLHHVQTWKSCN